MKFRPQLMIAALLLPLAGFAASYGPSAYVDSVASLVARVPQVTAPIVTTLGTNAVNDGGGRTFIWVAGDTTATNSTTVFASPHASGRWKSYSAVSSGGGGSTEQLVLNGISLASPWYLTNSVSVTLMTNANGEIYFVATGTNAPTVKVDGVSVADPDFTDGGDINFGASGASITGTVKADSVALGTDTTGNYVASVAGTSGRITASGSGEGAAVTLDLATSGVSANTYTAPTITVDQWGRITSAASVSYQITNANLTTLATLNGASLTNLNGSSIASGTVAAARIDSAMSTDAEVAAGYQPLDSDLTTLATLNGGSLTNLNASNLASGTVPTARLGSGTANSSTYLRGDNTWATPPGGGTSITTNTFATGYPVAVQADGTLATTNAIVLAGTGASEFISGLLSDYATITNGITNLALTASRPVGTDASKRLASLDQTGTGAVVLSNAPTLGGATINGSLVVSGTNAVTIGGVTRTNWPTVGAAALDDLTDVNVASATTGQYLAKQADGNWWPTNAPAGGGAAGPFDYLEFVKPDTSYLRLTVTDDNIIALTAGDGSGGVINGVTNSPFTYLEFEKAGGGYVRVSANNDNQLVLETGDGSGYQLEGGGGGGGSVTSVGLTMPTAIFDIAGSPVTSSGTLAVTLDNQNANEVFAGPSSGGAAAPAFRALVDADIPSAIARDSEVSAAYQPLDADLTSLAGGTAMATAITNAASVGAPLLIVGTTNVAAELALKAPLASPALTGNPTAPTASANDNDTSIATTAYVQAEEAALIAAQLWQATNANLTVLSTNNGVNLTNLNASELRSGTVPTARLGSGTANSSTFLRGDNTWASASGSWDGSPIASGTITNLTSSSITLSGVERSGWPTNELSFRGLDISTDFASMVTTLDAIPWGFFTAASGTLVEIAWSSVNTNHPGVIGLRSSTSANSGGSLIAFWGNGDLNGMAINGSEWTEAWFKIVSTNAVTLRFGFHDTSTSSDPVDGATINVGAAKDADSWNYMNLITRSNSTGVASSSGYRVNLNTWYRGVVYSDSSKTQIVGELWDESGTKLWSDTNTTYIPWGRALVHAFTATTTNATSAANLVEIDYMRLRINRDMGRTQFATGINP